jgi:peptide/nickel transport system permease protein
MKAIARAARWRPGAGGWLAAAMILMALAAPALAPNGAQEQFADRAYAPPTRIHVLGAGGFRSPFLHPLVLEDRLARRYREDTSIEIPLRWLAGGRLVSSPDPRAPLMLLGGDALGRDVFSRLASGARLSLGVTLLGVIGALVIGTGIGGLAGTLGGWTDSGLMLAADFLLALPGAYLVLVLRGVLPPVLTTAQVFLLMSALFALSAWPHPARGVRAIVASERAKDYAEAARAAGAGPWRLAGSLIPAAGGFLAVELVLLVPALLVAEATVSYLGLGFSDAQASWGTMMQDAANGRVLAEAPWMLAPAAGVFLVVLGAQLIGARLGSRTRGAVQHSFLLVRQ